MRKFVSYNFLTQFFTLVFTYVSSHLWPNPKHHLYQLTRRIPVIPLKPSCLRLNVDKCQAAEVAHSADEPNHSLPHLHDTWRYYRQDEVEPDVCEDAPEGGDEEHPEVFDLAWVLVGDRQHADPKDHKHVEGGAADDGARPQLTGLEVMTAHLQRFRVGGLQ